MPRPKKRPEDRLRAYKACVSCKALKKRCDTQQPCSACVRRDCASSCTYPESSTRRRASQQSVSNTHQSQVTAPAVPVAAEPDGSNENGHYATPGDSPVAPTSNDSNSTSAPQMTKSRMLLNSKGERVYIGEVASLSFLHFLRHILKQQMGPTAFTDNERKNVMLEANDLSAGTYVREEDHSEKRVLINCYFAATSGLLHLYTRNEVSEILTNANNATMQRSRDDIAAVNVMIAIGAQCRGSGQYDSQIATKYFDLGQRAAFESMLQDPSVSMVRLFLLMAFYMLGACRRNGAFMYIGVASKAASALGLHVADQYRCFSKYDQDQRLRTWKSLCILDLLVTSILGRLSTSPMMRLDISVSNNAIKVTEDTQALAFNAIFGECALIGDMVQNLSQCGNVEVSSAEHFLKELGDWNKQLPSQLRKFERSSGQDPVGHELAIGNIHVACVYYFAVMLITRPFLISHLMSRLPSNSRQAQTPLADCTENSEISKFAQVCIDSAIYMAKMSHEALKADFLLSNMCMLKAWMFAAGLVLGFAMFAQGEARTDVEDAFHGVREVLKKLSDHSPQAEEYYDILTSFSDAINRQRQQAAHERRMVNKQYVNEILTFDINQDRDRQYGSSATPGSVALTGMEPTVLDSAPGPMTYSAPLQLDDGMEYSSFGWDNMAVNLPDNFLFDVEPLGMFFGTT